MGRRLSISSFTLIGLVAFACSTSQLSVENISDPNLSTCSGTQARKRFEFTLSSYGKLPAGIPVEQSKHYMDKLQSGYDFAARHWIQRMLQFEFTPGEDGKGVTKTEVEALGKPMDHECGADSGPGLCRTIAYYGVAVRTGPSNFVLAMEDKCSELVDPMTQKQIVFEQPKENCRPYCHVKGIDDPAIFSHFCENSWFNQENFISQTGFHGWDVVSSKKYYSVPDREKEDVCKKAGLNSNCFHLPADEDFSAYDKSPNFNTEYPFINAFIDGQCKSCLHSYYCAGGCSERTRLINALKSEPALKIQWESALSKDLFLKSGTSMTKKVDGDWIIYRVEWDPSFFCKYEKPTSDLYTH